MEPFSRWQPRFFRWKWRDGGKLRAGGKSWRVFGVGKCIYEES
jgi:hypothetical protein